MPSETVDCPAQHKQQKDVWVWTVVSIFSNPCNGQTKFQDLSWGVSFSWDYHNPFDDRILATKGQHWLWSIVVLWRQVLLYIGSSYYMSKIAWRNLIQGVSRIKKNCPASPRGYLGDKTVRGGKETISWNSDRRGMDEVESRQQVSLSACFYGWFVPLHSCLRTNDSYYNDQLATSNYDVKAFPLIFRGNP